MQVSIWYVATVAAYFVLFCSSTYGQNVDFQEAAQIADEEAPQPEADEGALPLHTLVGTWTYRSFRNDPTIETEFNDIEFGRARLIIETATAGQFRGRLDFGPESQVALKGWITYGNPPTLRFQGRGTTSGSKDWVYDYRGYYLLDWPHGVDQRPAIAGTVIRTQPHSGGQAAAGDVASWIAVKQDATERVDARNTDASQSSIHTPRVPSSTARPGAHDDLIEVWRRFYITGQTEASEEVTTLPADAPVPAPESKQNVLESETEFREPQTITPKSDDDPTTSHTLETTLVVDYGENMIGRDNVKLRSYNGQLTGPTLRARPGDTLRVTLDNRLPQNTNPPADGHNSHHNWNTTNLHTHGLHVSPVGNSDNVLLHIEPGQQFEYEIRIPADHPAGTFWYHGHKHGAVAAQVASGMSGALIIEGGVDELPEIKTAADKLFLLQQIPYYDDEGRLPVGVIEPEFAVDFFGPDAWRTLKRFTTINGQVQPVIRMQPGEVQRWRFIDSGFREKVLLELQSADAQIKITFHEIAVDGLPLGKIVPREQIELFPGYRSDVLVKAPAEPGIYLLVDEASEAEDSLLSQREARKWLARVVVEGEPKDMSLPGDESLERMKDLRLPSIADDELEPNSPHHTVTYGIEPDPQRGLLFAINGKPYDPSCPRILHLGRAEEWLATSLNPGVNVKVHHPFHIHINPFEVVSIKDENDEEQLRHGPLWRDTIILRDGWKVRLRMRYRRYIGDFVQHCHILDHEDQGMMELISVMLPPSEAEAEHQMRLGSNEPLSVSGRAAAEGIIRHTPGQIHPPFGDLYAHGVEVPPNVRLLYIAGQVGVRRDGSLPTQIDEELDVAWNNVKEVLNAAGMAVDDLIKVTCYIKDPAHRDAYAASVQRHLDEVKPAMTAPIVRQLWLPEWHFEIDAVAARASSVSSGHLDPSRAAIGKVSMSDAKNVYDATWSVTDASGKEWTEDLLQGRSTVLVFTRGFTCFHCAEQINMFSGAAAEFLRRDVRVMFVVPQSIESLQAALGSYPTSHLFVADPSGRLFRRYECQPGEHSICIQDSLGMLRWRSNGQEPWWDMKKLLALLDGVQEQRQEDDD